MKSPEQSISTQEVKPESEQERRAYLISRYIETKVIGSNMTSKVEGEEIQEGYAQLSPREKADILYQKLLAYRADKEAGIESPDAYLIDEIKVLFGDPAVKELLPETYSEARIDSKELRSSELGKLWKGTVEEIAEKEKEYKDLEQNVHLNKISEEGALSAAKSHMERLAQKLSVLEKRKVQTETLTGIPKTVEYTDIVASFQYENLKRYKEQLDKGFVWLPSRRIIHQKTVSAILNHRWPVLIGEAGSGKSEQADAAAMELTGYLPTEIESESNTGELQLIKELVGENLEKYGALMQAFTGYEDSKQEEPTFQTGRIARFDESGRLGPKAYSIIKKARQKKPGDDFYGHPMLPGASAIWTSNQVGPRYPDRHAPDPAMRRELAEIIVNYPDMSVENPELYEFALAALQDKNNHITVAEKELAPAYDQGELPEDQREVLEDGSIVIAKPKIIENMADRTHGALWRFSAAIKALQDSFIYGNAETEKYPETLLRFKEDADNNIEVTTDSTGEALTLSTSTVTLGEFGSWLSGWNERRQKLDEQFRVNTLTEWFNFKINTYLEQADRADKEKLRAIFRHFGFLDKSVIPNLTNTKPLTPQTIGYLSPRVPRSWKIEKPNKKSEDEEDGPILDIEPTIPRIIEEWSKSIITFEDDRNLQVASKSFVIEDGMNASINVNNKFVFEGEIYEMVGVIEDDNNNEPENGKPVGKLVGSEVYIRFTSNEVDEGVVAYFSEDFLKKLSVYKIMEEKLCKQPL